MCWSNSSSCLCTTTISRRFHTRIMEKVGHHIHYCQNVCFWVRVVVVVQELLVGHHQQLQISMFALQSASRPSLGRGVPPVLPVIPSQTFAPSFFPATSCKGPRTGLRRHVDNVYVFAVRLWFLTFHGLDEVKPLVGLNVPR